MRWTFLLSLMAGGAVAEVARAEPPVPAPGGTPSLPAIECFCTDREGARVDLGQTICLMVDGRAYLARCEMSLNSPMWRDTGSDCVGAGLGAGIDGRPARGGA